ncbi:TPA: ABC transporter ATP-binding protein [Streptococcus agalactiae]|jgi:ABC-type multidrug transport system, ATPase and permease components|uniref:ABC transporter, ATP-binding/permease protein n=4 Tax=Streptococcus TaxID=1301 RepID=Q8DZN1_STRA5|nr:MULTISPECIES: ABC transporter ATP-binding protein [Streptococcus]EPX00362.1 sugar ABC transporter ATP-binding protein [Streptococcus agalactiae MRI Z1-049]HEO8208829.1 ABC transporter ATP-binding protein [Streptococcus agalactiae ADL-350]AAM99951.1 ABC transporter, ATP-binding/permease protein [Streptococcus agalactiae 2603V/R]AKU03597.1 sugar ABC transporter ATP-binding protein [Streptococcus agalactiae]AQY26437.1 sugar ABC transporter ATP-binding protein [Streptococcus agalactiae]
MKASHPKKIQKKLVQDLLSKKSLVGMALLGTVVQVCLTVYLPVLIGQAVDVVLSPHSMILLLPIMWKMIAVILANTIIQWINPLLYNRLIFHYVASLRKAVMEKLNLLPIAYLDKRGIGDLISRVTTDTEQLSNGLLMVFNQFFVGLLTIIVTIFSMAKIDLLMLFLVLFLTPLSLFLARFIAKKSYHLYQNQTASRGRQTQFIEEMVSQESLIQAFSAQEESSDHFRTINQEYANFSQSAIFYSSTVNPSTRFINSLIYGFLAGIGALRIMSGAFSVGQLITFLNYVNQYTKPFNDISSVLSEMQSALACAERLYSILEESSPNITGTEKLDSSTVKGQIDFKNVVFGYNKSKLLLNGINLHIPAGAKVAIVGPTGAGKSTLINLIMRFYEVDGGNILLDCKPITDYEPSQLRQEIGMVLQETWLKSATIHDNIAYANPKASREEVIEAAKAANADFFIKQLPNGYDTYLEDAGDSLSQGQCQLLTIARIFLKLPRILILDEATSSIDTRTEVLVQEAFQMLMKGRTSFIIAHRLSTIQTADIILVMVSGEIVEVGNHSELMAQKGIYYQMQNAQK